MNIQQLLKESEKRERYWSLRSALQIIYELEEVAEERFLSRPTADNEDRLRELDSLIEEFEQMKSDSPLKEIKEAEKCLRRYIKEYWKIPWFKRCLNNYKWYFVKAE